MADRHHARHNKRERLRRRQRRFRIGFAVAIIGALVAGVVILMSSGDDDSVPVATPGSAEQLALGEEVFSGNCATCHGEGLVGGLAGPPLIDELYRPDHHPDDAIRAAIRNGVQPHHWDFAGMPPITGLDEEEVAAVIAYIRDVQNEAWAEDSPDS